MTLDFWSNLCCLCSPRNTCIPVFVYSAVKERLIKCRRVSFELWKEQVLSWTPFFPRLPLTSEYSLLGICSQVWGLWSYFWLAQPTFEMTFTLLPALHPLPPSISPPDTTFWSISCRVKKGLQKLPVDAPTTVSGRLLSLPSLGNKGKPLTFEVPEERLLHKI